MRKKCASHGKVEELMRYTARGGQNKFLEEQLSCLCYYVVTGYMPLDPDMNIKYTVLFSLFWLTFLRCVMLRCVMLRCVIAVVFSQ
jgi:hypothetical protein